MWMLELLLYLGMENLVMVQCFPYGAYTMTATAQIDGETIPLQVTTTAEVRSVKWNPQLQQLALEIGDGIYIPLAAVERISN